MTEHSQMEANPTTDLSAATIAKLFAAGLIGLLVWEAIARFVAPAVIGGPLSPIGLIVSLFKKQLGVDPGPQLAAALHYATGIVFYPIGYWLLIRITRLNAWIAGSVWGVATWILALGIFALLAGFPFMLNFSNLTWMSLAGHLGYALSAALAFARLTQMTPGRVL